MKWEVVVIFNRLESDALTEETEVVDWNFCWAWEEGVDRLLQNIRYQVSPSVIDSYFTSWLLALAELTFYHTQPRTENRYNSQFPLVGTRCDIEGFIFDS